MEASEGRLAKEGLRIIEDSAAALATGSVVVSSNMCVVVEALRNFDGSAAGLATGSGIVMLKTGVAFVENSDGPDREPVRLVALDLENLFGSASCAAVGLAAPDLEKLFGSASCAAVGLIDAAVEALTGLDLDVLIDKSTITAGRK